MNEIIASPSIPTKILLPVDFSPSSQRALATAADLASHFHSELRLLHIIPILPAATFPDFVPENEFIAKARLHAEQRLTKAVAALTSKGIRATYCVETGNDVPSSIMEVVERDHADLLVISTHGISGWHPLVFGSIAEKVVKLVECPLLLLRSPKPDSIEKIPLQRSSEWW